MLFNFRDNIRFLSRDDDKNVGLVCEELKLSSISFSMAATEQKIRSGETISMKTEPETPDVSTKLNHENY